MESESKPLVSLSIYSEGFCYHTWDSTCKMHGISPGVCISSIIPEKTGVAWPKFQIQFMFNHRSFLTGVLSITALTAFSLSSFAKDWRRWLKCDFRCCTLASSALICSSCSRLCSFFWQGSRIEETTSVIPFMQTTACWIPKLMNAGRSLLLTLSGTIGRVASSQAFVESGSCFALLLFSSLWSWDP